MTMRTIISKTVLLPCSKIYGAITYVRNKMFDWGILKQHAFDIPVVVVGNIAVGGTGKTPHVEYIIEAMRHSHHIAVLSRGYRRKTKGFVLATDHSTPADIGDETYQMYRKYNGTIKLAVCEDRVKGIEELRRIDPQIDLVLLDDAFQHRYVKPTVSIVVTEYGRPLYKDHMLPYGRLRENIRGVNRADIVVVSKCPTTMQKIDYRIFIKNLNLYPCQELFFSRFHYLGLVPLFPDQVQSIPSIEWLSDNDNILAVAGIGNPRPFIRHLKSFRAKVKVNIFPDHHAYTRKDIEMLLGRYRSMRGERRIIITTEKDAVRMLANPYFPHDLKAVTFYLPVTVKFASAMGEGEFVDSIKKLIR